LCLFDAGIRDGLKAGSGSRINNPDHTVFPKAWKPSLGLKFFDADPGSEVRDGNNRIREGKKSDPEAGINIPDPQH
jgi:hypothetical protein